MANREKFYKEPSRSEIPTDSTTKNDLGVDLISRADALALYCDKCGLYNCISKCASYRAVEKMPPATPQEPRWIPIEEKMPEDGQSVLFCDIDNDIMIGYHIKGRPKTHFSQDGTYEDMKNVRAWMPLPKPFKTESKEQE